jgi:DNA-binding transcriptional MerR regulator
MSKADVAEQIQAAWNARELAQLIGIPPTTLIAWIRTGLVTPDRY